MVTFSINNKKIKPIRYVVSPMVKSKFAPGEWSILKTDPRVNRIEAIEPMGKMYSFMLLSKW